MQHGVEHGPTALGARHQVVAIERTALRSVSTIQHFALLWLLPGWIVSAAVLLIGNVGIDAA